MSVFIKNLNTNNIYSYMLTNFHYYLIISCRQGLKGSVSKIEWKNYCFLFLNRKSDLYITRWLVPASSKENFISSKIVFSINSIMPQYQRKYKWKIIIIFFLCFRYILSVISYLMKTRAYNILLDNGKIAKILVMFFFYPKLMEIISMFMRKRFFNVK